MNLAGSLTDGSERTAAQRPAGSDPLLGVLAAVLAGLAAGATRIAGLSGRDGAAAIDAMRALGAGFEKRGDGWRAWGTGNGCLLAAREPLEFGGADIAATLLAGLASTYDMETVIAGASLSEPDRTALIALLAETGAQLSAAGGLRVHGAKVGSPVTVDATKAAPQAAVAMLLAGLNAPGTTSVRVGRNFPRAVPALLRRFGVPVTETETPSGLVIEVTGQTALSGTTIDLAGIATATVIAIDGPAGGGKGTLARRIADYYHLNHLDTGLTYRAVAQALLAHGLPLDNAAAAETAARQVDLTRLDRAVLAAHAVGEAASRVAVIPAVRRALVEKQRGFAAIPPGAVLDGRDIGTVVCPDADVKLYVTATAEVRAGRRLAEIEAHGGSADFGQILADIRRRDERDMGRADSPLRPAQDAHLLDTSEMDIEAAFRAARDIIDQVLAVGKRD
ncbi:MAG: (d)CMP kinase [Rhizobiaceae bacterium]|nr:(d)CMP kinase [Rhizobiaceae bacterium]